MRKATVRGRRPLVRFAVAMLAVVWSEPGALLAQPQIEVGHFSSVVPGKALPAGWQPLEFPKIPRHTRYELVRDGTDVVVQATSDRSASGVVRPIRIDPRSHPIIAWRWKIQNVLEKADVRTKAGDDYPARLYVTFEYDPEKLGFLERAQFQAARMIYGKYPPTAAINYVWDGREEVGAIIPNAYSGRAKMIVVESGSAKAGRWVDEERNLLEDYRRALGEDPPMISAVAIMTDTDDTGEATTAWYGDIVLKEAHSSAP